ncbi:glycosyltransferase [Pelagibacterium montanilacus]|uniref:glycosyltransferase n=1 Tax=Pelagibacterium montanilacus TaxID=2185280 RepID=UPI000F8ED87A|nr:glycosyltransferase [Pelagibacterium montanilacus]
MPPSTTREEKPDQTRASEAVAAHNDAPVFFDPTRRRWFSFIGLSFLALTSLALMGTTLGIGIVQAPNMKAVTLAQPDEVILVTPLQDDGFQIAQTAPLPVSVPGPEDAAESAPIEIAEAGPVARPQTQPLTPEQHAALRAMPEPQTVASAPSPSSGYPDPVARTATSITTAPPLPRPRPDLPVQPQAPAMTAAHDYVGGIHVLNGRARGQTRIETLTGAPSIQILTTETDSWQTLGATSVPGQMSGAVEAGLADHLTALIGHLGGLLVSSAHAQEAPAAPETLPTYAFHVNWSGEAMSSLHENIQKIDVLLPLWVHIADESGRLGFNDPLQTDEVLSLIDREQAGMEIAPVLSDMQDGESQNQRLANLLTSASARDMLARNLLDYVTGNGFRGITIDFGGLTETLEEDHYAFLETLSQLFGESGFSVHHVLPFSGGILAPEQVSERVDSIIVTGIDLARLGQSAGPLAPQPWFEQRWSEWTDAVAPEKLIYSFSNSAVLWQDDAPARRLSVLDAFKRAGQNDADVVWDAASGTPTFSITTDAGRVETVWMLDATTAYNQLQVVRDSELAGLAVNRLGTEDPAVWNLLSAPMSVLPETLEPIDYSYQITRVGQGEITRLVHEPQPGQREITTAPESGRITDVAMTTYPQAYEIDHWGGGDQRRVVLTFDDGPHPVHTPQILDILAKYDVKASFFALGSAMMRHPELVERIVAEGHEIGNHTFSHVNVANVSRDMLRLDLNATQRVFESITSRNMALFRAPYAADANPRTPSEVAPLATVAELGYLTVNMNIDPLDWWAPNAQRISSAVLRGVRSGLGNVVLLHDGGGDRSQTVEALPTIIETMLSEGYELVPASALVGLSPEQVMPEAPIQSSVGSSLQVAGFSTLRVGEQVLGALFLAAIVLGVSRALLLIVLSCLRRPRSFLPASQRDLKVGVVVPAYNEEKVILKTIHSLLESNYANMTIVVVDDGSRDNTYEICARQFADHPMVSVFRKPNGGKAAALNFGFEKLDCDVVVALDADTVFLPDTVARLAAHFRDPRVAAVAGNAKVGNRNNLLTRWQAVEYITAQNLDRRAFEILNAITVVPGAVGAWRRDAVLDAGGFTTDTLAEDADLTIRLLRAGYRVSYEPRAIALTEAPERTGQLFRQRFRWMFGMLQVAFKHRSAMKLRDSKGVGLAALPNILIFQILFPLVAPVADLVAVLTLGDLIFKVTTNSALLDMERTLFVLALFSAFMLLDFLSAVVAFAHERRENWWLLALVIPQRIYYRQVLYLVAIKATLSAIRGSLVGWGTLARTDSVKLPGVSR